MKNLVAKQLFFISTLLLCITNLSSIAQTAVSETSKTDNLLLAETFDEVYKAAYASGEITTINGTWLLTDALVRNDAGDKTAVSGSKAMRIRGEGIAIMQFDLNKTVSYIDIHHATFGQDAASTWQIYYSTDQGNTWQTLGTEITTNTAQLTSQQLVVNLAPPIRFALQKTSGGKSRINIDNFLVYTGTSKGNESSVHQTLVSPGSPSDYVVHSNQSTQPSSPSQANNNDEQRPAASRHLYLGTPRDADNTDDHLLIKSYYALSYNRNNNLSNWVSWQLSDSDYGSTKRSNNFDIDNTLPPDFERVGPRDYQFEQYGYERGHIVRSKERSNSSGANNSTFLMTNIMPQTRALNGGPWLQLEEYCQKLCTQENKQLYIIAGGIVSPDAFRLSGKVAVPHSYYKIIVILNQGETISDITPETPIIAVLMPNTKSGVKSNWHSYKTSIDEIEAQTGYDFLDALPDDLENLLED